MELEKGYGGCAPLLALISSDAGGVAISFQNAKIPNKWAKIIASDV